MRSAFSRRPALYVAVVAAVLLVSLTGCDTEAERASAYQRFVGTWTLDRLTVSGVDETSRVGARYDTLQFVFAPADTPEDAQLRLQSSEASPPPTLRGPVQLLTDGIVVWSPALSQRPTWTYEFETSRRLTLRSRGGTANGMQDLLEALFPRRAWSEMPDARFQLFRE